MKTAKEKSVKAYKVFNSDWTCRGFQFEVGKSYSIKGEPEMCSEGFHACKKVSDCFSYYDFNPDNKVAEVELSGIILGEDGDKQCAQKILILKELSWNEMLVLANSGKGNSGHSNPGDWNSGHSNSGDWNSGDWNSGDRNSGDWNSGDRNSGDRNSGDWNSGHRNSGDWNSGDWNSGDRNSGDWNSGDWNSGDRNSGDWNSGDRNSGDWNSGDRNSGFFNSTTPDTIFAFNKPCKSDIWNNSTKPSFIYNLILNQWISWDEMSDDQKKDDKNAYTRGGYLKTFSYKEAWLNAFNNADKKDIEILKSLPNFDNKVFEDISGIKL